MLINGQPGRRIAADDRGLSYGDGVFRTLRVAAGKPLAWTAHMTCLRRDCERLGLPVPAAGLLYADVRQLFAERGDGVAKIMITRGRGGRGYAPPAVVEPVRIVSAHAAPPAVTELVLGIANIRLPRQPALAGIKHLNRLEQVLARAECGRNGWADALLLDSAGYAISTTMRNIMLCIDGHWLTPALAQAGVAGATRARIMAAAGDITPCELTLSDCYAASAMIACNSVAGVTPVRRLATHEFPSSVAMAAQCRAALHASEE